MTLRSSGRRAPPAALCAALSREGGEVSLWPRGLARACRRLVVVLVWLSASLTSWISVQRPGSSAAADAVVVRDEAALAESGGTEKENLEQDEDLEQDPEEERRHEGQEQQQEEEEEEEEEEDEDVGDFDEDDSRRGDLSLEDLRELLDEDGVDGQSTTTSQAETSWTKTAAPPSQDSWSVGELNPSAVAAAMQTPRRAPPASPPLMDVSAFSDMSMARLHMYLTESTPDSAPRRSRRLPPSGTDANNELCVVQELLVEGSLPSIPSTLVGATDEQEVDDDSEELEGSSTFVRSELDITKLFPTAHEDDDEDAGPLSNWDTAENFELAQAPLDATVTSFMSLPSPSPSRSKTFQEGSYHQPALEVAQDTSQSSAAAAVPELAPQLQFAQAQIKALQRKVESLTSELKEARQVQGHDHTAPPMSSAETSEAGVQADTHGPEVMRLQESLQASEAKRLRLNEAKQRIRWASRETSKSLEFAVNELRAVEQARVRAEERARVLEAQVQRAKSRGPPEPVADFGESTAAPIPPSGPPLSSQPYLSDGAPEVTERSVAFAPNTFNALPPERPARTQSPEPLRPEEPQETLSTGADKEPREPLSELQASPSEANLPAAPTRVAEANAEIARRRRSHVNESQWSFADMYPDEPEKDEHDVRLSRRRGAGRRQTAGPELLRSERKDPEPEAAPRPEPEAPAARPRSNSSEWASSRESLAPFATEASTRDLQNGFSLLERKLMMINLEREKHEAELAKLTNKGIRTKYALEQKIFLEQRLRDLHQEASNTRFALKRQPK
ncbi:Hypothetical Protein FCC1311_042732 [Hondaea fermentalgiana]|uniref:Uncharacterized protein n=1 Tax=Hondaea fermentalgiana TaxID=2315210 RepID=A0A2R5GAL5_9STRA|nr:Hypothetical Protein FCC1311_042732 [Hondaea fermentalgiana]|eukprot:GBG28050.1 Hypothetical Protein FCC1311_042732 [Hondaea fermentalgiana]